MLWLSYKFYLYLTSGFKQGWKSESLRELFKNSSLHPMTFLFAGSGMISGYIHFGNVFKVILMPSHFENCQFLFMLALAVSILPDCNLLLNIYW